MMMKKKQAYTDPNDAPVADVDIAATPNLLPIPEDRGYNLDRREKRTRFVRSVAVLISMLAVTIPLSVFLGTTKKVPPEAISPPNESTPSPTRAPIAREEFESALSSATDQSTFAIPTSSQSLALDWLMKKDPEELGPSSENLFQRYILMVMFFAAGGSGWDFEQESWLAGGRECDWEFVECLGGDVIEIKAAKKRWDGTLPSEIGLLSNLKILDLTENEMFGNIPKSFFKLTLLEHFRMSGNKFNGTISEQIGKLTNLENLEVYGNDFSGIPPFALSLLTNMATLDFGYNRLEGRILDYLTKMVHLERLILQGNEKLRGSIPNEFDALTNLERLSLHVNEFSGSIPPVLGKLTQLTTLDLRNNALSSSIPTDIGNLDRLWQLLLQENELTGTIPTEIGRMKKLDIIHLADNNLNGTIPTFIGQLSRLEQLILYDNALTGTIPTQLGNLPHLRDLLLQRNDLVGPEPKGLCKLRTHFTLKNFVADCLELDCDCCSCSL